MSDALPADVDGYAWRTAFPADASLTATLIAAANDSDDARDPDVAPRIDAGAIVIARNSTPAAGWVERRGARLHLQGWVHPAHRRNGLGAALLAWQIAQARTMAAPGDILRLDRVLRDGPHGLPADAIALYEAAGLRFNYIEHEMHRDLTDRVADVAAPERIRIAPWTLALGAASRDAYNDAFRDRGGRVYTEAEWPSAFFAQEDFIPDASFLALDGKRVVGFVFSLVDGEAGWIDSIGVVPKHRGAGTGAALVVAAMRAFRAMGVRRAVLRVNADNDRASRLYRRLGFMTVKRHVSYAGDALV